jgi:WD repeat-containing protein 26
MLDQFKDAVTCGVWSPVGTMIITGSQDREYGLCIWDNNGVLKCKVDNYLVHDLQVSPDGKHLVVLSETGVHVYDLDTLNKIQEWILDDVKLSSINISKDSRYILLSINGSPGLALVELESGEVLKTFQGSLQDQYITRNCFGGTKEEYVVSGSEGEIFVLQDSVLPRLTPHLL